MLPTWLQRLLPWLKPAAPTDQNRPQTLAPPGLPGSSPAPEPPMFIFAPSNEGEKINKGTSSPPVLGLAPAAVQPEAVKAQSMSILSDLMNKKITFSTAAAEAGQWVAQVFTGSDVAKQTGAVVLSDLKQAASNAVALAGGELAQVIMPSAAAVEAATNQALLSALGPLGAGALSPGIDHAIETVASALKAEIDAAVLAAKAKLAPTGQTS